MTDIINGDIYKYFGTEEALFEASHITNIKTGERVELPNDAKTLYSRMRKRYQFFTTSSTGGNKGTYYDNIEELADSVNISKSTALRCLRVLKQVGLVVATLSGRSNQWTITDITPDCFKLERNAGTKADPVWVDCLKHPVFGNAKEAPPAGQQEEQREDVKADPICELDEVPEDESPAPDKVKQKPKFTKKPAPKKTPASKQQALSPFEFKKPRDEAKDWFYLQSYNDADRFTGFTEFDLPYLAMFDSQRTLTNEYAIQHLKMKRELYTQQQIKRNNEQ